MYTIIIIGLSVVLFAINIGTQKWLDGKLYEISLVNLKAKIQHTLYINGVIF